MFSYTRRCPFRSSAEENLALLRSLSGLKFTVSLKMTQNPGDAGAEPLLHLGVRFSAYMMVLILCLFLFLYGRANGFGLFVGSREDLVYLL